MIPSGNLLRVMGKNGKKINSTWVLYKVLPEEWGIPEISAPPPTCSPTANKKEQLWPCRGKPPCTTVVPWWLWHKLYYFLISQKNCNFIF
jgi:hypothetical protein